MHAIPPLSSILLRRDGRFMRAVLHYDDHDGECEFVEIPPPFNAAAERRAARQAADHLEHRLHIERLHLARIRKD